MEKLGLRGPSLSSQIHVMLRSLTSLQRSGSNTVLEPTPPEPQAMTDAFLLFSGSGVIDGGGAPLRDSIPTNNLEDSKPAKLLMNQ